MESILDITTYANTYSESPSGSWAAKILASTV
jgi:hypothetical protein